VGPQYHIHQLTQLVSWTKLNSPGRLRSTIGFIQEWVEAIKNAILFLRLEDNEPWRTDFSKVEQAISEIISAHTPENGSKLEELVLPELDKDIKEANITHTNC